MTPEMQLAKMLSPEPSHQEKLASAFDGMSIEELEQVLRDEGVGQVKEAQPSERLESLVQWADDMGREMAKKASIKKIALPVGNMISQGVGRAANAIAKAPAARRMAVGAGAGAVAGAVKNPGYDAQGNQKSRIGGMLGGAAVGAGAGLAAKPALRAAGKMNNGVGTALSKAQSNAAGAAMRSPAAPPGLFQQGMQKLKGLVRPAAQAA